MKVRITIDLSPEQIQWIKKQVKKEIISRNELFSRIIDHYRKSVEIEGVDYLICEDCRAKWLPEVFEDHDGERICPRCNWPVLLEGPSGRKE